MDEIDERQTPGERLGQRKVGAEYFDTASSLAGSCWRGGTPNPKRQPRYLLG